MMNQRTSFLTRFLALALAVVLVASGFGPAVATRVSADTISGDYVYVGDLVANNYDLTDAEKTLLVSGYLSDTKLACTPLKGEGLVKVDTETATITAEAYLGWEPVEAVLVAPDGDTVTVTFKNGIANYDPAFGYAFSAKVFYKLTAKVDRDLQAAALAAPAALKTLVANMDAALATNVNLGAVAEAMDVLVTLADGVEYKFGPLTQKLQFRSQEAIDAVYALAAQNDGLMLDLQLQNSVYAGYEAKTMNVGNAKAYNEAVIDTYKALYAIADDELTKATMVDETLKAKDPVNYRLWMALKDILNQLVEDLGAIANEWTVPALSAEVDYVELDAMVKKLDTVSTVEIKDLLDMAEDYVTVNQGVKSVEYKVVLMVTNSENKVVEHSYRSVVLGLRDNATKAEIEAAIAAKGEHWVVNEEAYKAEHFTCTTTELPEVLTEDISYVVTYAPKSYTVTYSYDDAQVLPYGAVITLPVSEDAEKAFDYTVNGDLHEQGQKVMVNGDMTITRTTGKAYYSTDLYAAIAGSMNADSDFAKAVQEILNSGALKDNVSIKVRRPEADEAQYLLHLEDGVLTAQSGYASDYNDLKWAPYKYGFAKVDNVFNGTQAAWGEKDAKVVYGLDLTNFTAEQVEAILQTAAAVQTEGRNQIEAMARLVNYKGDMKDLNGTMLTLLQSTIASFEFYKNNPTENVKMRAFFGKIVQNLLDNHVTNGNLTLYTMLEAFDDETSGGMRYYYGVDKNGKLTAETLIEEVLGLSEALNGLVGEPEHERCLGLLLSEMGRGQYVDKIGKLGTTMAEIHAALSVPNAAIDLQSDDLGKLLEALNKNDVNLTEDELAAELAELKGFTPKLTSDELPVTDSSNHLISVKVIINKMVFNKTTGVYEPAEKASATYATLGIGSTETVSAQMISELQEKVDAFVNTHMVNVDGVNLTPYYTVENVDLDTLVGKDLTENVNLTITYTPNVYTVNVEGAGAQQIHVENRWVSLPNHKDFPDFINVYTVNGVEKECTNDNFGHTFSIEDLTKLFADGSYNIPCYEIDRISLAFASVMKAIQELDSINKWHFTQEDNKITSITVDVAAGSEGIAAFAQDLTQIISGEYPVDTVMLNRKALLYPEKDGELTVAKFSVQTLLDAILSDENFSNETLIELGENGKGTIFSTNLTLGWADTKKDEEGVDEAAFVPSKVEVPFTMNLMGVPTEMGTVSKVLSVSDQFFTFSGAEGFLDLKVTLPDELYYAYLSTMVDYGTLDKTNLNEINNKVAFQFLFDLYEAVMNPDIDTETFQNTLDLVDVILRDKLPEANLTQYEAAYQKALNFFRGDSVDVTRNETDTTLTMSVEGQDILAFMKLCGYDLTENSLVGLIKEMGVDAEGNPEKLKLAVRGTLANANTDFEAVVIDVRGPGATQKFVMTEDLAGFDLHGAAAITLIDDVEGDLTFNALTLIDLNGHTITGDITANAKVIFVDSVIDNAENCGGVNGELKAGKNGSYNILAGKYTDRDAAKYVRDGYVQDENGAVHSAMYKISNVNNNVTFELNSDFTANTDGILPDVYTLAANIAVDIVTNYHTSAALTYNGLTVYDFTVNDIIGLLASDATPTAIVNTGLNFVQKGFEQIINDIMAELLDFGPNAVALANGTTIASFDVQSARWTVDVNYVEDGNYLSGGMAANYAVTDEYTINIAFAATNETAPMAGIAGYLDGIVDDETYSVVDIYKPVYANGTLSMGAFYDTLISLDLSDETHVALITTALAAGSPDKAVDLMTALNQGATEDGRSLKQVIDAMTLADVCESLTVFVNAGSYAAVASILPEKLPIPVSDEIMEKLYDCFALVASKALDLFSDFRGDVTIANFDRDDNGIYEWDPAAKALVGDKTEGLTGRDYTLDVDYSADLKVKVNLFCRLGDVNHDGKVNSKDAAALLQYAVDPDEVFGFFCTRGAEVNGDRRINSKDAAEILNYAVRNITEFPIETMGK